MIAEIANASEEQASGLQQINTAINSMDQTTQQNASMVEETTAACHSLTEEMRRLSELMGQFKVNQNTSVAALRQASAQMAAGRNAQRPASTLRREGVMLARGMASSSNRQSAVRKPDEGWEEF